MDYKILQAYCIYDDELLSEVGILWADNDSVRATYSNLQQTAGYENLTSKSIISSQLFQNIAAGGRYLDEVRKEKHFPDIKNWSR